MVLKKAWFNAVVMGVLFALPKLSTGQTERLTVSGFVKDSLTGETLPGANIVFTLSGKGVTTNTYGFFSLTGSRDETAIVVSYVGYIPKRVALDGNDSLQFDVLLSNSLMTDENAVVITGRRKETQVAQAQMGKVELTMERIKQLPAFMGEVDILKALQLMPGIRNAGEGNAGLYVRGGGADQNLVMLDDAVVYNPGHLFGFFSVFNGDAIKNVSLIKGGMPAEYGGRLSSVVDVTMKEGNNRRVGVEGGVGTIASRLALQGPLNNGEGSYLLAARRTYIDALISPFIKNGNLAGSGYFFYDANAKFNYRFGSKDRVYASGYFGRDVFDFNNKERAFSTSIPWGNSTATLRWNHVFSKRLFSNTTAVFNNYRFRFDAQQNDFRIILNSGIRDWSIKTDYDFFPRPEHRLKFGGLFTYHTFFPNTVSGRQGETEFSPTNTGNKFAREFALYAQDEWDVTDKIKLNAGLRYSSFGQVGPYTLYQRDTDGNALDSSSFGKGKPVKQYSGFEPRLTARFSVGNNRSIKAGITRNLQYIHLATNSGTTFPTDLWVPSTFKVQPQQGWQYAVGYFQNFNSNIIETSVEVYYKTMENQIEFKEGYTPSLRDPEDDFVFGKAWSYGAEFLINKTSGRLNGWFGYSLSYTWRQFDSINGGMKYPAKYDRRHDLSIVANYNLNKRWRFGAVFVYATGNAATFPERFYLVNGVITQEFSRINAYRLPAYHRADLSATYTSRRNDKRKLKQEWVFSVYNMYSRMNPYFIYFAQEGDPLRGDQKIKALQVSLFPILPAVTWNFKF